MKKILPYILIFLVVVQFFAPLTVGMGEKDKVEFRNNKAEANYANKISLSETPSKTDKTITINFTVAYSQIPARLTEQGVRITKTDPVSGAVESKIVPDSGFTAGGQDTDGFYVYTGSVLFDNLTQITAYPITVEARQINTLVPQWLGIQYLYDFNALWDPKNDTPVDNVIFIVKTNDTVTTNPTGTTTPQTQATQTAQNDNALLPNCSVDFWNTVGGCFGQLLYWGIFQPTSVIFAGTGRLLDISIDYSTKDTSYRSPFVLEGWKIVRDFCNLFFIFVLLYIAFGTILGLNGVKTKEMIVNVVIIGLLINFSLFTTQVIIDASNIMTRVFYNSNTIKVGPKIDGVIQDQRGSMGEIKLSEAIVAKINPQKLILESSKVDNIQTKQTITQDQKGTNGVSAKTFILVTILASVVNIVGLIVFLMSSLIFIARVIGLWLAMILAPLVFFTYTVPQLQDMEMIGWKKWWPETIKLAFLAPIFMFFLYLIIKFLDSGLGLAINDTKGGLDFILGIFVPFIFIMILLTKAKDIAKTMSGKMGQTITNGLAAAGGIALGGTALGVAALGRNTIGSFMKGASTGDTAAQRLAAGDPTLSNFGRFKGRLQQMSGVDWAQRQVGARLNANQHDIQHATHSRSELDSAAGEIAHGKKWEELNGEERFQARRKLARDRFVRENSGTTGMGFGTRKWESLTGAERLAVDASAAVGVDAHGAAIAGGALDTHTTWDDTHTIQDARRKVGLTENLVQSTIGGSFDVRNLSKIVAGEQDRGLNKFATGLTSALASGMRGAIKQTNVNYGVGQKDFIKDLGSTITEALKSTTIKVDLSHVGEEKKEDAHGGGGHH